MFTEQGFTLGPAISLTEETFYKREIWVDRNGPLRPEWRNADRQAVQGVGNLG